MTEPIIKIEHLSHRYSVQWAVRDINLNIQARGIYGLLGSNGAGKSTLMNIICGVLKQTEGNVFINETDIRKFPVDAKKNIGFLPQTPPLQTELSVEEFLRYAAEMRLVRPDEVDDAIDTALRKCGIEHFRKRLIRNLSGGYQQRVGIAQAIIHRPLLVVLDEPTNGLDPNQIVEIRHLIQEIAEDRTVLLSTHMLSEVQATCDHIYMVEHGEIVFSGTVRAFNDYIEPSSLLVTLLAAPAEDDLLKVDGVTGVEQAGEMQYRLHYSDAPDLPERMVHESVKHGWRMTGLAVEKKSMDTIFAELSGKAIQDRQN